MIQAVLSNAQHPEYGVATIPFPIPRDEYDHCIELLEALEISSPSRTKYATAPGRAHDTGNGV